MVKKKKVPQTKVFQKWSKWFYWNKQGRLVGPFDTPQDEDINDIEDEL